MNAHDEIELACRALAALPASVSDDRDAWLKAGMAARSISEDLFPDWEAFSARSEKFKPTICRQTWQSFKRDGIGPGSLFDLADRFAPGWRGDRNGEAKRRGGRNGGQYQRAIDRKAASEAPKTIWKTQAAAIGAVEGLTLACGHEQARDFLRDQYGLAFDDLPDSWHVFDYPGLGPGIAYRGETPDGAPVFKYRGLKRGEDGKRPARFLYGGEGALVFEGDPGAPWVIVAGEEKALAAHAAGYSVLCPLTGEHGLSEDWRAWLIARNPSRVILANDADATGHTANDDTARALELAGLYCERIAVISWPDGAPAGYDLNDVALAGGREAVRAILEAAPLWRDPQRLSVLSIDEIFNLSLPENDNLLGERYLARGEAMGWFGAGDLGKSRLAMQLAFDSILGRPFAGAIETHDSTAKWLFIQTENSARRLIADLSNMLRGISRDERARVQSQLRILVPLRDIDREVNFSDRAAIERLRLEVIRFKPDVVVFDPLADFYGGEDENNAVAMRDAYHTFRRIARAGKPDAATLIIHHARTGRAAMASAIGWDKSNFARGSKALFSAVRAAINIAQGEPDSADVLVLSCGKSNNGRKFEPFAIRLNHETMLYTRDDGFDLDSWRAEVNNRRSATQAKAKVETIIEIMREAGENLKKKSLIERLKARSGASQSASYTCVKRAIETGIITEGAGFICLGG